MNNNIVRRSLRRILVVLMTCLGVAGATVSPASAWVPVEPTPAQPQSTIGPCTSATQLDCIESIGAFLNGSWVDGTLTGRTAPNASGGVCCHEWQIPGLVNEDGDDKVETQATLDFPGTSGVLPRFQFEIHASTRDNFRVPYESGSVACTTNKINGVCVRYGNTQRDVRFRAVIRTSWLQPSVVTPKAGDVEVTTERLTVDGASKITVEGVPYDILGVDTATMGNVNAPDARGAWKVNRFAFVILDTRYLGPAPQCADKPTLVVADNSWRPSVPGFDATTGVLSLRIDNPHFDTDGTTVWSGKYQARIPLETAQCMWGSSVDENTRFTFDVSDPDDPANEATVNVSVANSMVVITATNFHYSAPTLSVRAVTTAPTLPATGRSLLPMAIAGSLLFVGLGLRTVRRWTA